jgi:hypothetical protein
MRTKKKFRRTLKKLMLFLSLRALEQHIHAMREQNAG